jgi:UDP-4-amino-4,6-dideoxy-N-acetyl-beta-L-altrosamine transaminase
VLPYSRQNVLDEDIAEVVNVLRSDFLTQGPYVAKFEQAIIDHVGSNYAVAVNSATSALHIACMALGVSKGDIVWTSAITFVASANCAALCGANVDFVDIDLSTVNISVEALSEKLIIAKKLRQLPKVLVVVHMCGLSADMAAIRKLSLEYGFKIIEDASHALGAMYLGEPVGSCKYSEITVFSFHPVKIITSGEGGVAVTNSQVLFEHMQLKRTHGVTRDPEKMQSPTKEPWFYEQVELGLNYRMSDIQAALGASQIKRLRNIVEQRNLIAERYDDQLASLPLSCFKIPTDCISARHLYVIRLKLDSLEKSKTELYDELLARGIGVNVHYIPLYKHPYYKKHKRQICDYPNAEEYYAEALSIPLFPQMTFQMQDHVINSLKSCLTHNSKAR